MFEIQLRMYGGKWENTTHEDDKLVQYDTYEEAEDDLKVHFAGMDEMGMEYVGMDYRIQEVEHDYGWDIDVAQYKMEDR